MEMLDRMALVVTPKRRFVEWVNTLQVTGGSRVTMDEVKSLRTIFLVAADDDEVDLQDLVDRYCDELFDACLAAWTLDESAWPVNRTPHVFRDWFQVDGVDQVADADPSEPLLVSERARTRCANCNAPLDESVLFVALGRQGAHRLTADEAASHEARDADGPEDAAEGEQPEDLTIVVRCCGNECAAHVESSYALALGERDASRTR